MYLLQFSIIEVADIHFASYFLSHFLKHFLEDHHLKILKCVLKTSYLFHQNFFLKIAKNCTYIVKNYNFFLIIKYFCELSYCQISV
jgi:hypothetical protein